MTLQAKQEGCASALLKHIGHLWAVSLTLTFSWPATSTVHILVGTKLV